MGSCGGGQNQRVLPFAVILMTGKSQIEYMDAFNLLNKMSCRYAPISEESPLKPLTVIIDFEKAAANAFELIWPEIQIRHCYFHFAQNITKSSKLLFPFEFGKNLEFHIHIRSIYCLCFFAEDKIDYAYHILKLKMTEKFGITHPNLTKLGSYIEPNYIGGNGKEAQFKSKHWSVKDRVDMNFPRTNNLSEAFNKKFQRFVGCEHPSITNLINVCIFNRLTKLTIIFILVNSITSERH